MKSTDLSAYGSGSEAKSTRCSVLPSGIDGLHSLITPPIDEFVGSVERLRSGADLHHKTTLRRDRLDVAKHHVPSGPIMLHDAGRHVTIP